jgi:hypothetical protein
MKIALIGTSPIMLLLAIKLSKKNEVIIFEGSQNLGGAWGYTKIKGKLMPAQTNMVIPKDRLEQKKINKINSYMFKNYNVNSFKISNFSLIQSFKPKNIFMYELIELYKMILKLNIKIFKKRANSFSLKQKKIIINNVKFDKIYLPYFSSIKYAQINKKKILLDHNSFRSKHLTVLLKEKQVKEKKNCYIEKYDKVFDRMLFVKKKELLYIIARIKRIYKNSSFEKLTINTKLKQIKKKDYIIKKKYTYYLNNSRDIFQIKKLNELKKYNQIKVIDTTQFIKSFLKLKLI